MGVGNDVGEAFAARFFRLLVARKAYFKDRFLSAAVFREKSWKIYKISLGKRQKNVYNSI